MQTMNPPAGALFGAHVPGGKTILYPGDIHGDMFFVDSNSGADTNSGLDPAAPLATIDAANNLCTASHDDWIICHPAHAENLAADSAIDLDLAGVTLYGLRRGRQMPTLTVTAAAGDIKLAAANVTVQNIRVLGGIDVGTGAIEISAADCSLIDSEYRDVTGQATDVVMAIAGADRLQIKGYKHFGAVAAGANSAIALNDAEDVEIMDFYLHGNFAVGAIDFRTVLSPRVNIHTGKIWTVNAADVAIVDTITSSTGFIGPDIAIMLLENAANITTAVTGATFQLIDPVYVCNLVNEKAMLINWTASTD